MLMEPVLFSTVKVSYLPPLIISEPVSHLTMASLAMTSFTIAAPVLTSALKLVTL